MPATRVDIPEQAPKPTHRYVTIPDTDLFDQPHPHIKINHFDFGPGTHYLETELAGTVEDRLKAYTRANVRILQPNRDMESENIIAQGGRGTPTTHF